MRVAFHFSKVPSSATDAFTENLTELSAVTMTKTGASCARVAVGVAAKPSSRTDIATSVAFFSELIFVLLFELLRWTKNAAADRCTERREATLQVARGYPAEGTSCNCQK